ncbi:MAG: hypothetical protein WDM77_16680 [Steroidobacteraceae bacterium]
MRQVKSFIVLTGAATLAACASVGAPPPAAEPVAAHTVSSHAPTPNNLKIPDGYTRVVASDGTERFCRSDAVTGSRLQHDTVCLTAQQLQDQQNNAANAVNGINSRNTSAAGAGH